MRRAAVVGDGMRRRNEGGEPSLIRNHRKHKRTGESRHRTVGALTAVRAISQNFTRQVTEMPGQNIFCFIFLFEFP